MDYLKQDASQASWFYLTCYVRPHAKIDRIYEDDTRLCIDVRAPPSKGEANEAVRNLVANKLKMKKSQIQIVKGATSAIKILKIETTQASLQALYEKFRI